MTTKAPPEAVTREELEQALRALHLKVSDLREDLLALAAQVVAEGEAAARTRAATPAAAADDEAARAARTAHLREELALADLEGVHNVHLADADDKYRAVSPDVPCVELWPICHGACCGLEFPLSPQDLDEGVVRWDYANPYLIRHHEGRCVHNANGACTVYAHRPGICRTYDCRDDPRIWDDFANRVLASGATRAGAPPRPGALITRDALVERLRARQQALATEAANLSRPPIRLEVRPAREPPVAAPRDPPPRGE
jgi:hypothetical protein